jgi:two-component system, chemotaxis family, sensor kinase CheA
MSGKYDPALLKAFLIESTDILERFKNDLDILSQNPADAGVIDSIFRSVHTIKGNSSFLDLAKVTNLAHKAETLLDRVRKKKIPVTATIVAACEAVREDLQVMIEEQNFDYDISNTILNLDNLLNGRAPAVAPSGLVKKVEPIANASPGRVSGTSVIRIEEARFDRIVSIVSELELFRNSLELIPEKLEALGDSVSDVHFELDLTVSKIAHLTRSLSSLVLGAKLVRVNQVFLRFPKVVQDLAQKLSKSIVLDIHNGEAELDKSIVDAIADPMTHLIRNSADHGIEMPDDREKKGKNPVGRITLNSYVKGNFVYIEISDDGRGIDPEKIIAKAVEKGILPREKALQMSEAQKLGLIFAPGFSTAEQVTDISGRGVGMDVVKSNINRLKGSVLIQSRVGHGTTIQLRFPMSMVVLLSLFVDINGSACAVPLDQVDDSCDYRRQELLLEMPKRQPEKHLSLFSLSELLWGKKIDDDIGHFHILRFKGYEDIGFIVEEFLSIEEALVQSVDSYIAALPGVQGATIRKDGTVSLVLNTEAIVGLAQKAKPFAFARKREKIALDPEKWKEMQAQAALARLA